MERERWFQAIERHRHNPGEAGSDEFWEPALETGSREELRAVQSDKLPLAVAYMAAHSPMYAEKLAGTGIEPGDVRGIEDLLLLPVVTKDDMSRTIETSPPWGTFTAIDDARWMSDGWQVFNTSGTTAAPRAFRYTQRDREWWSWADARAAYAMGIRRGKDVGMMLFGYAPHVAMWGLHHALLKMGVPQLAAGSLPTAMRAQTIDRMRPTVIACTPSYALHIGSAMREMGIDPARTAVRIVIVMGEALPEASERMIAEMWDAEVHQFYGCTEAAPSCGGYTCTAGKLHFLEDTHILETLDPDTWEPVPDGTPGVSVVTNLMSEASPQVRFVVGDYTTLSYEGCDCGRTHVIAEGGFSGRADDLLNIRGVTLFPSAVEDVVRAMPALGEEFKITVTTEGVLDELILTVEDRHGTDREALSQTVVTAFQSQLELRPVVEVVDYGTLPRPEMKAARVDDRR